MQSMWLLFHLYFLARLWWCIRMSKNNFVLRVCVFAYFESFFLLLISLMAELVTYIYLIRNEWMDFILFFICICSFQIFVLLFCMNSLWYLNRINKISFKKCARSRVLMHGKRQYPTQIYAQNLSWIRTFKNQ